MTTLAETHPDDGLASGAREGVESGPAQGLTSQDVEVLVHELRASLTVVSGYAQILRRTMPDDERDRCLAAIERAVERANCLLEEVRGGRLPDGRGAGPLERLSLAELALGVAAEQGAAAGRQVEVVRACEAWVRADRIRLEGLVANLLDNALKHSPRGKTVTVRVSERTGRALIEVSDEGPGIPEGDRERVIEPFERLPRDASTAGLGLGLAIAHSIAEAHGGSLRISDGASGVGTTIAVELPLADDF